MDELSEVRAPTFHLSSLRVKVKGSGTLWGPNDELDPPQGPRPGESLPPRGPPREHGRERQGRVWAHLLVVRDLSYQHLGDLPGHVTIIVHFSLPENSDVCPDPATARPQLPHLTCTPLPPSIPALDQWPSHTSHRAPNTFLHFLPTPSSLSHIHSSLYTNKP